ncbi:hypothetical protein AC482_07185 [miscellaneous Crenarchaeota group-15 archaeon DG-45]|uniref:Uncharacterized protein n=1 Tax=miscellaneous Crenarchaeota group-15 archaeon DG-45 TaxID=1685127 RepID=A0A0M0BKW6_9ARCH|nr:MAG: hypothetical protein AC482_07185 [miscellaneous Crenarchaeota group-15 archaeon DG-45]
MMERFSDRINELEAVTREIAIDITTGALVERLSPGQIWERAGERVIIVGDLLKELREYLYIMKPEKVPTIQRQVVAINERLDLFKEALERETLNPPESSRRALEELRQALVDISDFLSLCKEARMMPSPVIGAILSLRRGGTSEVASETMAKMEHLAELIRSTQAAYGDISELTSRMGTRLDAVRSEYESLILSFRKKEEN